MLNRQFTFILIFMLITLTVKAAPDNPDDDTSSPSCNNVISLIDVKRAKTAFEAKLKQAQEDKDKAQRAEQKKNADEFINRNKIRTESLESSAQEAFASWFSELTNIEGEGEHIFDQPEEIADTAWELALNHANEFGSAELISHLNNIREKFSIQFLNFYSLFLNKYYEPTQSKNNNTHKLAIQFKTYMHQVGQPYDVDETLEESLDRYELEVLSKSEEEVTTLLNFSIIFSVLIETLETETDSNQ